MMQNIPLVLGLGKTGFSVARYFKRKKIAFRVIDTRAHPPQLDFFRKEFPEIPIYLGNLKSSWLQETNQIIVSPGLNWNDFIAKTGCSPKVLLSDIDLFNQEAKAAVIAITGSNGKSTTTALIEHLIKASHKKVYIGGNFGIPALDLLERPIPDFYLLELSSFQLTLIQFLEVYIGVFLNLNEDHIDRHGSLKHYHAMKQKIYRHCKIAIWNRDNLATAPLYPLGRRINFGSSTPLFDDQWGMTQDNNSTWLAKGNQRLLNIKSLAIQGKFNALNTLAALAVSQVLQLPLQPTLAACVKFKGLAHRCEKIIEHNNITWINDSKSTNVNATIAAIQSLCLGKQRKLILILGGVNKNKNLNLLPGLVKKYVKHVIVIGQAALEFKKLLQDIVHVSCAQDLQETVEIASNYAKAHDIVLLSPACASFDMFKDYIERGERFTNEVHFLFHPKNI